MSDEEKIPDEVLANQEIDRVFDGYIVDAVRIIIRNPKKATVSALQHDLDIGWARAGRIIDQLELIGVVAAYNGSKPREVLILDIDAVIYKLKELSYLLQKRREEEERQPKPERQQQEIEPYEYDRSSRVNEVVAGGISFAIGAKLGYEAGRGLVRAIFGVKKDDDEKKKR